MFSFPLHASVTEGLVLDCFPTRSERSLCLCSRGAKAGATPVASAGSKELGWVIFACVLLRQVQLYETDTEFSDVLEPRPLLIFKGLWRL